MSGVVGVLHHREMAGRVHTPDAAAWDWCPVTVWFRWLEADPLAVTLTFANATMCPRWTVSRDVLAGGLERSAGSGDFLVWPDPPAVSSKRSTRTRMTLRSPYRTADDRNDHERPDQEAAITVVTASLRKALEATFAVVAAGQEYAPGSAAAMVFDAELFDTGAWAGGVEGS